MTMFKARAVRSTKLEKPRPLRSLSQNSSQPTSPISPECHATLPSSNSPVDNTSFIETSQIDRPSQIHNNNPVKLDDVKDQVELLKAKLYENQQTLEQVMQLCNSLENENTDSHDHAQDLLSSSLSSEIRSQLESSSTIDNRGNDNSNVPSTSHAFIKPPVPICKPILNGIVATPKTGGKLVTMRTPYTNLRRSLSEPAAATNDKENIGDTGRCAIAHRYLSVNEQGDTPFEEEILPLMTVKDINDNHNTNNNVDENQNMFTYNRNEVTGVEKKWWYVNNDISPVDKPLLSPFKTDITDDEQNERGFPYTNDIMSPVDACKPCYSPFRYDFANTEQKEVGHVNDIIDPVSSKPRYTSFKDRCEEMKKRFVLSSASLKSSSCESEKPETSLYEQHDRDFYVDRFKCMKKEIASNPALFTKSTIQYSIVDLVALSVSPLSNTSPKGWSYLAETFPGICLNQTIYFEAENYEGLDEDTYSLLPDQHISGLSMRSSQQMIFPFNPRLAPPRYGDIRN